MDARPLFYQLPCDFLFVYKTLALNMSTTKKSDDHFQRESEQTAQKRKRIKEIQIQKTPEDSSIKNLPLKRHAVA